MALARDRHLAGTQACLSAALLAHGQALSTVVAEPGNLDRAFLLQCLHDAGRLLTDVFHQQTVSRRPLILPKVTDKLQKQVLMETVPDGLLFGPGLADKLAKAKSTAAASQSLFAERRPARVAGNGRKWPAPLSEGSPGSGLQTKRPTTPLRSTIQAPPSSSGHSSTAAPAILPTSLVSTQAGNIALCYESWAKITTDHFVLQTVQGYRIVFSAVPFQSAPPKDPVYNADFSAADVAVAISNLRSIGAIVPCAPVPGQFLSPFFMIPKPDGDKRFIFNLRQLNSFIETEHFQLEDGRTAMALLSPGDFMGKIDLSNAYYSVRIHPSSRKYLRFTFQGHLYEFTCLPFGLCSGPYIFTKIFKLVLQHLRNRGFRCVAYLDDLLFLASTATSCSANIEQVAHLLESLGFQINEDKTLRVPSTRITFLGLVYDSVDMAVSLPSKTQTEVLDKVSFFATSPSCSIRAWAAFIGLLNFCCQAVPYGRVYLKLFERTRFLELALAQNDFDALMTPPRSLQSDFQWWVTHLPGAVNPIRRKHFQREIFSDASNRGWGAFSNGTSVGGPWSTEEARLHINTKELRAALYGLRVFAADLLDSAVLLRIDNTTAVTYIDKMGGIQSLPLNAVARDIWQFCEERSLWVFASYIPSSRNVDADLASRSYNPDTESELGRSATRQVFDAFGQPDVDIFASASNSKCRRFFSWFPDLRAETVDAFTRNWHEIGFFLCLSSLRFNFALLTKNSVRRSHRDCSCSDLAEPSMVSPFP